MGTHPIFESDFDCLTEDFSIMAFRGFLPLANRCLIRRAVAETKSAGGIMLPESSQTKLNIGKVMAVGEGFTKEDGQLIPLTVAVGENVLLPEFGGTEIDLQGEKFMIYRDLDFLGKMEDDA